MNLAIRLTVATVLLSMNQPVMVGSAVHVLLSAVTQHPAAAQSGAEAVAKAAQAITVRLEGSTQGSGVLVKRDGNRYTVLTAWHVVSDQSQGEELDVFTPDGQLHPLEQGSIKRFGEVDMAVFRFNSEQDYELASISTSLLVNDQILYVAGFPLNDDGRLRVERAQLIWANTYGLGHGYKILSKGFTKGGMSGGPLLNSEGSVVGIHGRGERARIMSREIGKTGINQCQSITCTYSQRDGGLTVYYHLAIQTNFLSKFEILPLGVGSLRNHWK